MSFLDDLQEVIWTSPSGKSFVIKTQESGYKRKHIGEVKENPKTTKTASTSVKAGGGKKSKTSSSASVSTTQSTKKVQDSNDTFTDMGIGGRDVTLKCYFVGEGHYSKAEAFTNALCEVGKSKLQLAYGSAFTVNVLDFSLSNSLVERINVTVVSVNWHETSGKTYPSSEKSKTKEIKNAAAVTKENIAQGMADAVASISTPTRLQSFTNSFSNVLNKVSNGLSVANNVSLKSIMTDIMGQKLGVASAFTITSQLGVIMYKAAALSSKVSNIGSTFGLTSGFGSYFSGWDNLISNLITNATPTKRSSNTLTAAEIDNLMINDSTASMAIVSVAESLIETSFETRAEAVEAAKNLEELENKWTTFIEEQYSKITTLEDYYIRDGGLSDIVAAAANEILERSHKLKVEKRIVLNEDSTIIELAYKYYNEAFRENPDDTINYLITSNGFSDDEFFLLKRGTELKIYV